jgi:hypothetical protein
VLRRSLPLLATLLAFTIIGCGKKSSPTAPTNNPPVIPTVVSIHFELNSSTIQTGGTTGVTIWGIYSDGIPTSVAVTFSSDAPSVATVEQSGIVHGVGPGLATIIARADNGVTATAKVTVIPSGPKTQFGPGTYHVNSDIAPGRYFSTPRNGCYWERKSGFGGTLAEIIANDFVAYDAAQYIVDIQGSDAGFEGDSDCGAWYNSPRAGAQSTIRPGIWLVGSQLQPGNYTVNAGAGCYWERLRDFKGELNSIISNNFIASARQEIVSISSSDVGFQADGDCGTWSPSGAPHSMMQVDRLDTGTIYSNWAAHRAQTPRLIRR